MADVNGNAQGVDDYLVGTKGDDTIRGYSGDDYLIGGAGNDILIGGAGSDVMLGGADADVFRFDAGHLTQDAIDWVRDFSFKAGDSVDFNASGGNQQIVILAADRGLVQNTSQDQWQFANSSVGTDVVLTVQNSVTGNTQKIVFIDSWSNALNSQWIDLLHSLGFGGDSLGNLGEVTL